MSFYVTLEGPEATGKTTQAELLCKRIRAVLPDQEIVLTKEPGSKADDVCQQIRRIILEPSNNVSDRTALFLFLADRVQHMESVVIPAINRGAIVISDRSSLSTVVYHAARSISTDSTEKFDHLYEIVDYAQSITPDLCLVTNANFFWASTKLGSRAELDRIEKFGEGFHKLVHQMFKEIALDPLPISNHIIFGIRQRMTHFPRNIVLLPEASKFSIDEVNKAAMASVLKHIARR